VSRQRVESGRPWNDVGYSRAIRVGSVIEVAGTTAMSADGTVEHPNDMERQTRSILTEMIVAIEQLGGTAADVVRTRMFVTDVSRWEEAARVHQEFFADVLPVSSMIEVSAFLDPSLVIEIEATALIDES